MQINKIEKISLAQSELLLRFENLVHGFTTREGGVSTNEYESLSLSPMRGDDIERVRKNREILCASLSLNASKLTGTKQEHTDHIEIIDENNIGRGISSDWNRGVDAVITTLKNVPLLCYSADCVPILLYARDIEAIGAVHSGWRGTNGKILLKTIEKMEELGAHPENIIVSIGPCIGQCCYEVSEDVASFFDGKYSISKPDGKFMLDLSAVNYDLAKSAGVKDENISLPHLCTRCKNDLFFSHRGQGGKSGTLGGIICMRD